MGRGIRHVDRRRREVAQGRRVPLGGRGLRADHGRDRDQLGHRPVLGRAHDELGALGRRRPRRQVADARSSGRRRPRPSWSARSTARSTSCTSATSRSPTRRCPPRSAAPTAPSRATARARRSCEQLAEAGINTVHLLPTFDIATIEEDRAAQATPACDLASFGPASTEQQACIEAIRDADGFNWGYDPFHFSAPEGSYAVDPNGGARVAEFREMVGALHGTGLQVVLDEVYNHTAASGQGEKSVLDQVVPGYYQRLNAAGDVETSTCCQNVATEHEVAEKLMVDSVVHVGARLQGRRLPLRPHGPPLEGEHARRSAPRSTSSRSKKDGVDGKAVYLYGEGWNFGEVANNALFEQATQGQLGGTGIGTFNDRLRDGVHGGSPVDGASTFEQGFGTGLGTDPNGDAGRRAEQTLATLGAPDRPGQARPRGQPPRLRADGMPTGRVEARRRARLQRLAGRLRRPARRGDQLRRRPRQRDALRPLGVQAADRHVDGRPRAHEHAVARDGRRCRSRPSFWHAGTELLRSKSLDRNSYNSGDWFNRIDWTGQESTFGSGLPTRGRQRRQVADHGAAAREPGAQAGRRRHRGGRGIRPRPAAGARRGRPAAARLGGPHRAEGDRSRTADRMPRPASS